MKLVVTALLFVSALAVERTTRTVAAPLVFDGSCATSIARLRGGALGAGGTTAAALVSALGTLVAANIAQNGRESHSPPSCAGAADLFALTSKADAVALWRASPAPRGRLSGEWEGTLLKLGVLAPVSALITHVFFGPASRWSGKAFAADGSSGANLFVRGPPRRAFRASITPSTFDGHPALTLNYAAAG